MADSTGKGGGREPLSESDIAAIKDMQLLLAGNYYELLGVARDATPEMVRDSYFQLSKRFHPDVFWRKDLGVYKSAVDAIFRDLTMAFDTLSNPRKRIPYDERLKAREKTPVESKPKYVRASYAGPPNPSNPNRPPAPSQGNRPGVSASSVAPPDLSQAPPVAPIASVPNNSSKASFSQPQKIEESQRPFVSRAPTLGAQPPPFVFRAPTLGAQPNQPPGAAPKSAPSEAETEEQLRRREAFERFNRVTRGPARAAPPTPTEPHSAVDLTFSQVSQVVSPQRLRPSDRPPPRHETPSRAAAPAPTVSAPRPRPSDRPPPPTSATVDARSSVESLLRQKLERGIQNRASLQADFEAQIAHARTHGDLAQMVSVLRQAVALCPEVEGFKSRLDRVVARQIDADADHVIAQAQAAEKGDRWDSACTLWAQAAAARPTDPSVHLSAAKAFLEHGQDLPKAADLARRAAQLSPSNVQCHVVLARVFLAAGSDASARVALELALRINASDPEVVEVLRQIKAR